MIRAIAFCTLLLASIPALAGYLSLTEPVPQMEALAASTPLAGTAAIDGRSFPCELRVERVHPYPAFPEVLEYALTLRSPAGAFREFRGELADVRNMSAAPGTLTVDVRGYPSHSKTRWHISLAPDGGITAVDVLDTRPLLFDRHARVTFAEPRAERFRELHGTR